MESQACRTRGRRTKATNQAELFHGSKKYTAMAAMESPVFDYVVFYFLLKTCMVCGDQRGCPGTLILAQTDAQIACLYLP